MRGSQPLDEVLLEHGGHGANARKEILELGQVLLGEHAGLAGCLIGIVRKEIPPAKDHIFKTRERHQFLDERRSVVSPFSQPHGSHLREGADGFGDTAANGLDAGHEGRGDSAHTGHHDSQLPAGGLDLDLGSGLREWHVIHSPWLP